MVSVTMYGAISLESIISIIEICPVTQFVNHVVYGEALHSDVDVR
jgi:hypothetical protein